MPTVITIRSRVDDVKRVEAYLTNGLKEEEKRITFAIHKTEHRLSEFEKKFNKKTHQFLEEFKQGLIEETPDIFDWWAESKLLADLQSARNTLSSIEICPQ
ncbi:hypothetical protein JW964_17110 [candidate division KSB1 bacterium]|nr:hypothetical protein [candidate division KSB1 bacterium]